MCASSGGPWGKQESRIGSCVIRGAGFDLKINKNRPQSPESEDSEML